MSKCYGDVLPIECRLGVECQRIAMDRMSMLSKSLLALAAFAVALPLFWMTGGISWLDTKVFPPRPPKDMPQNAVWIDAPALPISWHHGWWFGCEVARSGAANYCRLVMANGQEVYAGEYLPCGSKTPLPASTNELVAPHHGAIWIADKRLNTLAPVGALRNGDLLLPVLVLDRCETFKATGN
jgi:hypothetical protein